MSKKVCLSKMKRATKLLCELADMGIKAQYDAENDSVVVNLDLLPKSFYSTDSEKTTVNETKEVSKSTTTLGDRVRERKLNSQFARHNLRKAGALAKTLFKEKYGSAPSRNSKNTLVYPKTETPLLDEAINTVLEQIASKQKS